MSPEHAVDGGVLGWPIGWPISAALAPEPAM